VSAFRSLKHISAQVIDDTQGKTILAVSDALVKDKGNKSEIATKVGELLGKQLKEKKITQIVFDRAGFKYHGRIKALAEGIRKSGITF
jgi:large subunit ribosomal protein L18